MAFKLILCESKNKLAGPELDLFEHPLLLQVTPLQEGDQQKLRQLLKNFSSKVIILKTLPEMMKLTCKY